MPKIIKNDLFETWTINGDSKVWTLQTQASIFESNDAGIAVPDTSVGNTLKIFGDILVSGDNGAGIDVNGLNTRIVIGKQAEIAADEGIDASAGGLKVTNRGEIDGLHYGIINSGASSIKNFGDISGDSAISTMGSSKVVNAASGTIQGDFAGVNMSAGSNVSLTNHGMIMGNEFAVRFAVGGENTLVNTGKIYGDIEFGIGDDLLDSMKGEIKGIVRGGDGDDVYKVGRNDILLLEDVDDGIDSVYSALSWDLGDNFENLYLVGKAALNAFGSDEDNILKGNKGRNTLVGNAGDDELAGGKGNDALRGDDGVDTFIFKRGDDHDIVVDFVKGEDKISLVGFDNASDFEALQTEMFKNGNDVWIQLGNGDRLVIMNTEVGDFDAADFNFLP